MHGALTGEISHRRVLKIALPIVLSNVTVPLLGLVDTGVVGQLGEAAPIGAVGIGAIILTAIYWIFGFLRMATVGLVGQAVGRDDRAEVSALLTRALLIAGAAGLSIVAFQTPLFAAALWVSPGSAEVEDLTRTYLAVRIWSAPCAIAVFGLTGWLIAQERTGAVLAIQVAMNGLNIGLDLWFVLGLGWGVEGVAIATAIAECAGAALGFWFCRDAFKGRAWCNTSRVFDRVHLAKFASVGGDILLRSLLVEMIFVSFLFLSADFGDVVLAANQVLKQLLMVTVHALDGFAFAAEALVAQAFGAGRRAVLRRSALMTSGWGLVVVCLLSLAFAISGPALIAVMTTAQDVRVAAELYLPWMVAAPIIGLAAFMLDGVFIGATRSRDMRNMMAVSAVIYAVAVALLVPAFANHGLWAALLISLVARGVTLGVRYPALERAADTTG